MEEQEERVDGAGDLRGREEDGLDPRRASISNKTLKCSLFMSTCVRKDAFFFKFCAEQPCDNGAHLSGCLFLLFVSG